MEIQARVALSLPNKLYKIELKYDTFEKATYDSYLIASIVKNAKSESGAMKYIDEITGKGSLNPHFKKLYSEISTLSPEQIDGILNDSVYPITVVDRKHHFKYYRILNATKMQGKVYAGNLETKKDLYKELMPNDTQAKFLSISFETEDGTVKKDMYNAIFTDDDIKVDLEDGQYFAITKSNFKRVFEYDENLESMEGMPRIRKEITSGNWSVLTKDIFEAWRKTGFTYLNRNGNLAVLTGDYVKITEVVNVFDLLFYKETKYDFARVNAAHAKEALEYLKESNNLNNFRTKSLIYILNVVDDKSAQEVVEWFLSRKESKEIAEFGLKLIKNGLEKGWTKPVLSSIKKFVPPADLIYLYRIDSNLGFEIADYLVIPDSILSEAHLTEKRAFLAEKELMIKKIYSWIGEMAALREKAKKLQKNSVVKSFNDFANEYIGHIKKDFKVMQYEQLKKEFEFIGSMYNGNYQKVKAAVDKADD